MVTEIFDNALRGGQLACVDRLASTAEQIEGFLWLQHVQEDWHPYRAVLAATRGDQCLPEWRRGEPRLDGFRLQAGGEVIDNPEEGLAVLRQPGAKHSFDLTCIEALGVDA